MITLSRRKNSVRRQREDERREPLPIGHYLVLTVIGACALALRYWFNFHDSHHLNTYGACDASEYLRNAQALLNLQNLPQTFFGDAFAVLTGHADAATVGRVQGALSPLKDLQIAGPTFPAFLAFCYAVSLSAFSMQNWQPALLGQTIISALTCLFIALTGCHAFGKKTGYLAGFLAAIYPAFIINSGRLYSETFATFLLSVVLYITVSNFTRQNGTAGGFFTSNFTNGLFAAGLQFTRSIMAGLSAMLVPIILFQQGFRKGILGLVGFLLGFALLAAPWLVFQKLEFGKAGLIVDRVGHYNFFIGNNVATQGWLSFPYPDGRGIEEKQISQLAKESIQKNPWGWVRLQQDKPLRLFKFPWNDFRAPLGSFGTQAQIYFHQFLLLFAAIGAVLSYLVKERRGGPDTDYERVLPAARTAASNAAKTFLLLVFFLQCGYMLFITVPRYNLCAMPEVILFAAAGISCIFALLQIRRGPVAAVALIAATLFLFTFLHMPLLLVVATLFGGQAAVAGLVLQCILRLFALLAFALSLWLAIGALTERELGDERRRISHASRPRLAVIVLTVLLIPELVLPVNADGRPFEWAARLTQPGQAITQKVLLPADFAKQIQARQTYVIIDSDGLGQLSKARVEINGKSVDAPLIPNIALCDEFIRYQDVSDAGYMREGEWVFDALTQSAGMHNSDLRQWFIVPVATSLFKPGAVNDITLRNVSAAADHSGPAIYGEYAVSKSSATIPSLDICSWEKAFYGVENEQGLSDPRYDVKVSKTANQADAKDLSNEAGLQAGRYNIHVLAGPPIPFNDKIATVERTQKPAPSANSLLTEPLQATAIQDSKPVESLAISSLPDFGEGDLWIVRLHGKVRRSTGAAKLNVSMRAYTADKNKQSQPVAYISPWGVDAPFSKEWQRFDLAAPLAPAALRAPLTKIVANFGVNGATTDNGTPAGGYSEFKDLQVQIMKLPNNPLSPGHQIY